MFLLFFAVVIFSGAQSSGTANPTETLQRILVRQEELNDEWRKYDFTETETIEINPPPAKHAPPSSRKWEIHRVGNYELARLIATGGKPLSAKEQSKEDREMQKSTHYLEKNPETSTDYGNALPSAVASFYLRIMKASSVMTDANGDLLVTVADDPEDWTRYAGYTKFQHFSGTIRADSKTYSIKEFLFTNSSSESFRGGLEKLAPGSTYHYVQGDLNGHEFPLRYEQSGSYREGFGEKRTTHVAFEFSDFRPAGNAKSPARERSFCMLMPAIS